MKNNKIQLIIIVFLLLVIVGLVGFILGERFAGKDNKKEENKAEQNNIVIDTNSTIENTTTINGNVIDAATPDTNTNINTAASSINVTFTEKEVRKLTGANANFICVEHIPHITGIDSNIASKIEQELNNNSNEVWNDINSQTEDDYVMDLINNLTYDIGFDLTYKVIYQNNNVITFSRILSGGLGGVSWGQTSGISFDLTTGEEIKIANIVTDKAKYLSTCKRIALEQLKKDNRFTSVQEHTNGEYENIINNGIDKMSGYFTAEGIVCLEIPKYEITSGADGEFRFTVSYNDLKDCINNKYMK